ncbi:TonB-dependent receptor domain-containing protein [Qipengyuania flava]|uniref:TonB-dependent receptor n=1 Tax=Qipengyuania flava TaxID=192812 RepID=UPI002AA5686C
MPNTVKVINRAEMETQLAVSASLLDSLAFSAPSLAPARQKLTSTGESLRGRTPLYMVDGIPQSTPLRDGKRSGFTIDPAFVDRIEVIYGANAIQGVGATGGVINYETIDAPRDGKWLNRITAEMTTDDFESNGFHYRLAGLTGKRMGSFDFVAGAAYEKHDLFYDGQGRAIAVDTVQGELMDSRSISLFGKAGIEPTSGQRLEGMINYYEVTGDGDYSTVPGSRANEIPATSIEGAPSGDPTFTEALNASLSYSNDAVFGGELTLQGHYFDFYALYGGDTFPVFQDPAIAPAGTLFDQSALSSEKYGAKLTWVRKDALWEGLQMVIGADYLRDKSFQELAQTDRLWVPELIYKGWAPFVQLEQSLFQDIVRLSGGVRWENATLDVPDFTTIASANRTSVEGGAPRFDKILSNAGVVIEPVAGFTIFSSYAQGFTMPDAGLILRSVNTPGQKVLDLVDLQPIIADNIEVGTAWRRDGLELAASYFWSNSDLGSRIQVVGGAGQVRRERTEIEGFELAASYRLSSSHRLGLSFAALDGRYDSDGDDIVDRDLDGRNIAPDRFNAFAEGPLIGNLQGRLQLSRLSNRSFEGNDPKFDFDGYTLIDLVLRYPTHGAGEFTLAASNLLDEQYITYFSQTVSFVSDRDFVSGRGRALTLRWKGEF